MAKLTYNPYKKYREHRIVFAIHSTQIQLKWDAITAGITLDILTDSIFAFRESDSAPPSKAVSTLSKTHSRGTLPNKTCVWLKNNNK